MSLLKKKLKKNMSYPISLFDNNGNEVYYEDSDGDWCKYEYDSNGNKIYYEDSGGYVRDVRDDRPKVVKEMTVAEISQQLGYEVKIVK